MAVMFIWMVQYFIQQFNRLHFIYYVMTAALLDNVCIFAENIKDVKGDELEALFWTLARHSGL